MQAEDIEYWIVKQLEGSLSVEEEKALGDWYRASELHRKQYEQYVVLLKAGKMSRSVRRFDAGKEKAYRKFRQRTSYAEKVIYWQLIKYAAIAALFLGIGFLWPDRPSPLSGQFVAQRIEVPLGSKSKVTLPDGTQVWLNSGSRLEYGENFGQKERGVMLDGEGCFEVVKDKNCPFIVRTSGLDVKVLGTKFDLKAYAGDAGARVTLMEGSLKVSGGDTGQEGIILKPDEQAVMDKSTGKITIRKVMAADFGMWTQPKPEKIAEGQKENVEIPNTTLRNTLFFDNESLEQIACDLERAFNIRIVIADDSLKKMKFYGDFRNEETLLQIMDIISGNSQINYIAEEHQITIHPKK